MVNILNLVYVLLGLILPVLCDVGCNTIDYNSPHATRLGWIAESACNDVSNPRLWVTMSICYL